MPDKTGNAEWFFEADLAQLLREDTMPYLLINVIAKRARQLKQMEGRPLAFPANGSTRAADIAAAEVYEGKLKIVPRHKKTPAGARSPYSL